MKKLLLFFVSVLIVSQPLLAFAQEGEPVLVNTLAIAGE